jgi:hypothetical protein
VKESKLGSPSAAGEVRLGKVFKYYFRCLTKCQVDKKTYRECFWVREYDLNQVKA